MNSIKEVGYSAGLGLATSGMPLASAVGLSITGDWVKDGRYDVNKSLGSSVISSYAETRLGSIPGSPIVREAMTNAFEKFYENIKKENVNE